MKHYPNGINPYVVAEIGCNHQGSRDIALKMVEEAARAGANAVKFQKRDNQALFRSCLYDQIYDNPNSYGRSYGEHRNALELTSEDYLEIRKACDANDISLHITPFDVSSLAFCQQLGFDAYKIASADIHYHQLIESVCKTGKPIYLSTGGCTEKQLIEGIELAHNHSKQAVIYHCTSAYPSPLSDMNLNYIKRLQSLVNNRGHVGLSDHENGIDAATIAYMLGVRVFEKHFTLDRSLKGTDQAFSLEPAGLRKMIRNLNRVEIMLGSTDKQILDSEKRPLAKMIKTIVSNTDLRQGTILTVNDINFKVAANPGFLPSEADQVIGQTINRDMYQDNVFYHSDFTEE